MSLAGRPPFATDEPDSFYESSPSPPKRRAPPPKPDNPNQRTSAYNVYDNYLSAGDGQESSSPNHLRSPSAVSTSTSRNSGIGALGMGLLAMDSDEDDDSDDEEAFEQRRKVEREKAKREQEEREKSQATGGQASKNAALAAAIANPHKASPSPPSPKPTLTVPSRSPPPTQPSPPPIAAPKPGYAAQISALDSGLGKSPSPVENPFEPQGQQQYQQLPPHLRNPPGLAPQHNMRGPPPPQHPHQRGPAPPGINMNMGMPRGPMPPPNAMVRGMTPAPLAVPSTPIIPVFAIPKSASSPDGDSKEGGEGGIKWDDLPAPTPRKAIMRGNTEDAILPTRGEKGDDFWRRFSMIAKVEKKESSWLKKTKSGANRLNSWVWVVGLGLLILIGAAIGLGVYFTRGEPDHQAPETLGGSTDKPGVVLSTTSAASSVGTKVSSTLLRVTPTHTIAGRAENTGIAESTSVRFAVREHLQHHQQRKRRF